MAKILITGAAGFVGRHFTRRLLEAGHDVHAVDNVAPLTGGIHPEAHEPVQITARQGDAVLVSERDWRAIQETLYLLSVPGMRQSIREGLETPVEDCNSTLDW